MLLQAPDGQLQKDYDGMRATNPDPTAWMPILERAVAARVASLICELAVNLDVYSCPKYAQQMRVQVLDKSEVKERENRLFQMAADMGSSRGFFLLGWNAADAGDTQAAIDAWKRAAQPCNCCAARPCRHTAYSQACFKLGEIFYHGDHHPDGDVDLEQALAWYQKAIEIGVCVCVYACLCVYVVCTRVCTCVSMCARLRMRECVREDFSI